MRSAAPGLNDEEIGLLASAFCPPHPEEPSDEGPNDVPSRVCIDALALRAVIQDDLADWSKVLKECSDEEGAGAAKVAILKRLKRDKAAYHMVTGRLQKHQDTALVAGLNDFAEELRRVQRGLFSSYLKLAPEINSGGGATADRAKQAGDQVTEVQRLLEQCSAQDALVEADRTKRITKEELCVNALKDVDPAMAAEITAAAKRNTRVRRERLRLRVLTSVAAVLFGLVVAVYSMKMRRGTDELRVPVAELPETLILSHPVNVGGMMYAQISHWSWDQMDGGERLRSVMELGQSAADQGYDMVYLVNENNEHLASWSKIEGAKLVDREDPPDS